MSIWVEEVLNKLYLSPYLIYLVFEGKRKTKKKEEKPYTNNSLIFSSFSHNRKAANESKNKQVITARHKRAFEFELQVSVIIILK